MKKYGFFVFFFYTFLVKGQDVPSSTITNYQRIARLLKYDSVKTLAKLVTYPLKRFNPVPDINNAKEFISYYDTLFDGEFKKRVIKLKDSDIFQHEGNYGLFAGDIWIDENGKIISINHSSDKEEALSLKITNELKSKMYPEVNSWESNIIVIKCDKFIVRLDNTKDKGIRYVSWSKGKQISDKPDLILYNGIEEFQGTQGGVTWTFKNGQWTYVVDEVNMCENDNDCGTFLRILSNGKIVESIRCTEIK